MSQMINWKKCIQILLTLLLLGAVLFRAKNVEDMQQATMSDAGCQMTVKNPRVNYMSNPVGIDSSDIFFRGNRGRCRRLIRLQ